MQRPPGLSVNCALLTGCHVCLCSVPVLQQKWGVGTWSERWRKNQHSWKGRHRTAGNNQNIVNSTQGEDSQHIPTKAEENYENGSHEKTKNRLHPCLVNLVKQPLPSTIDRIKEAQHTSLGLVLFIQITQQQTFKLKKRKKIWGCAASTTAKKESQTCSVHWRQNSEVLTTKS